MRGIANILVTRDAGFIRSHIVPKLLSRGHDVVVLYDLSSGLCDNVPEGFEFVEGSILDHDLFNTLFEGRKFDHVFHLAAYAAEGLGHFIKRFNDSNNLIGTVNLINASVSHE